MNDAGKQKMTLGLKFSFYFGLVMALLRHSLPLCGVFALLTRCQEAKFSLGMIKIYTYVCIYVYMSDSCLGRLVDKRGGRNTIYVYMNHTWQKSRHPGNCRRYGAKNDAKWQTKTDVKLPKSKEKLG